MHGPLSSRLALVAPSDTYRTSFLEMVSAIQLESATNPFVRHMTESRLNLELLQTTAGWQEYLTKLSQQAKQVAVVKGRAPNTTFWLVDISVAEMPVVVGRLNVRHFLTPKLRNSFGHLGYIIHPRYRGQGYGRRLLELALPVAAQLVTDLDHYGHKVLLACRFGNQPSLALLKSFKAQFEREVLLPNGERELLYWLPVGK